MSKLTYIEKALLEATNIKRWNGESLDSILTENEAINLVDNITMCLDNAGYEIKKK